MTPTGQDAVRLANQPEVLCLSFQGEKSAGDRKRNPLLHFQVLRKSMLLPHLLAKKQYSFLDFMLICWIPETQNASNTEMIILEPLQQLRMQWSISETNTLTTNITLLAIVTLRGKSTYVNGQPQIKNSDILTKPLQRDKFEYFCSKLGLLELNFKHLVWGGVWDIIQSRCYFDSFWWFSCTFRTLIRMRIASLNSPAINVLIFD